MARSIGDNDRRFRWKRTVKVIGNRTMRAMERQALARIRMGECEDYEGPARPREAIDTWSWD